MSMYKMVMWWLGDCQCTKHGYMTVNIACMVIMLSVYLTCQPSSVPDMVILVGKPSTPVLGTKCSALHSGQRIMRLNLKYEEYY